ncbi:hypothetical protein LTR85_003097 [Meristemomyces frigidus]|nr:hypothetical protein LTR85_003097 [Meristemomyces frigidus]
MTSSAAASAVFAIPELLENILLHLTSFGKPAPWVIKRLFRLRRVNCAFRDVMATSPSLRRTMFLHHGPDAAGGRGGRPKSGRFNPYLLAQSCIFYPCTFIMSAAGESTGSGSTRELSIRTGPPDSWHKLEYGGKLAMQIPGSWREMRVMDGALAAVVSVRLVVEDAGDLADRLVKAMCNAVDRVHYTHTHLCESLGGADGAHSELDDAMQHRHLRHEVKMREFDGTDLLDL